MFQVFTLLLKERQAGDALFYLLSRLFEGKCRVPVCDKGDVFSVVTAYSG